MPNASFVHPNGSITFSRGPHRPDNSLAPVQPLRKSAGGVRLGFASAFDKNLIRPRLRLSEVEKAQFIAFWDTIVNGMSEPFTYTDTSGFAQVVSFEDPALPDIIDIGYDSYEVTVTLRAQ